MSTNDAFAPILENLDAHSDFDARSHLLVDTFTEPNQALTSQVSNGDTSDFSATASPAKPHSKILQSLRSIDNQKQQWQYPIGSERASFEFSNLSLDDSPGGIWTDSQPRTWTHAEQTWPTFFQPYEENYNGATALNLDSFQSDETEYLWKQCENPLHSDSGLVNASPFTNSSFSDTHPARNHHNASPDLISPVYRTDFSEHPPQQPPWFSPAEDLSNMLGLLRPERPMLYPIPSGPPPGFSSRAPWPGPAFASRPMTFANVVARGAPYQPVPKLLTNGAVSQFPQRNRLLEELRQAAATNSGVNGSNLVRVQQQIKLSEVAGSVVEFSRDQHGSRLIQQKLEQASEAEKQAVFAEILPEANKLMIDVFGNYVIQKFFEFGSHAQREKLTECLQGRVMELATQMYGCRVIQKALESVSEEAKAAIVAELYPHVMRCVKDQNGNHVIQKCIERVKPEKLDFVIKAFRCQVVALSKHPYGCRVIQRILEHCLPMQTDLILEEMHEGVDDLVKDQYGNYVIQHVLENGSAEDKTRIVASLKGKVAQLSMHKFASNVMEKAIVHANFQDRGELIQEVLKEGNEDLLALMKDQFANYVVQRMIELGRDPQHKQLVERIKGMQSTLKRFSYGKHILIKMETCKSTG